jgi:heme-degrading monooxygenase HmoA
MEKADPFLALVIYPTTADSQTRQADNLVRMASEQLRNLPGLVRARVLLSEDGTSLLTLTEWRDRESFQKFRESDFSRAASALMAELHPKAYWLRQHAVIGSP